MSCTCKVGTSITGEGVTYGISHSPECPEILAWVLAERERCAKVMCLGCRERYPLDDDNWHTDPFGYKNPCEATAILKGVTNGN